jgi:adenosylhomocysteine nucleosidase
LSRAEPSRLEPKLSEPTLLVIASDRRELEAIGKAGLSAEPKQSGLRWSARVLFHDEIVLLATQGPGRKNAGLATRWACDRFPIRAVVSAGIAGGLDPSLQVGDVVLADSVLELSSHVAYPVKLPSWAVPGELSSDLLPEASIGKLVTVDSVVQDTAAKSELRKTGARAVDMESSAVAAEAARRGLSFYCLRAISDTAATSFEIDFNRARRGDGKFSGLRVLRQVGFSRRRWKHLLRLRSEAEEALTALGDFFGRCRFSDKVI